jgi:DNA primase
VGIEDDDVAKVRATADIVQVISGYTQLKRVGRRWQGLCPFHAEKSPSFSVNAEEGLYHCFGCKKSGDVITFVRDKEQLDFPAAIEWLAAKYGIAVRYTDQNESESRRRRGKLVEAVGKAVAWYHTRLLEAPDAGEARRYLRSRGLDGAAVRQYRIGWAPEDAKQWDPLCRHLRLADADLKASGLGAVNSRGRQYDFFRGRVLFPIFDDRGDPVGFGGRILPGRDGAKYKNTSDEAVVYSKSKLLYGLNWAKESVVHAGEAVVCEGYTDVIGFAAAGVPRAVATCGTALTEEHIRLLKRFTNRVVLAFDADAAGQNAAARVSEWEQKLQVEFAVADLPDGVDPADLARADPARLVAAVTAARPFLGFRVERALGAGNFATPEGRARTAENALAVVREHPSDLVRDQYVMAIAERCRIDPDQLRARLRAGPRGRSVAVDRRPDHVVSRTDTAEDEALRLIIHRRDEIIDRLVPVLFASAERRAAFELLADEKDLHVALSVADESVGVLLTRLAVDEPDGDPDQAIADLARYATAREVDQLRGDAAAAQSTDDIRVVSEVIDWLRHRLAELDLPETRNAGAAQLVAWLAEHGEGPAHD